LLKVENVSTFNWLKVETTENQIKDHGFRFTFNSSLQNIENIKVADVISDAIVKKFKFVMKTDLICDAPKSTERSSTKNIFRVGMERGKVSLSISYFHHDPARSSTN
jgi:hypothetical protein